MKLTEEIKNTLDNLSFGALMARFRFFPHSELTKGETGKYIQEKLKEMKRTMTK